MNDVSLHNTVHASLCVSVAHDKAAEVVIESDPVLIGGNLVQLRWSPESIVPVEQPESYNVDITIRQYNNHSREWTTTDIVARVPNNGFIEVTIPEFDPSESVEDSICPVVIQISGISSDMMFISTLFSSISIFTRVAFLVKDEVSELARRSACEEWGLTQSRDEALETLASLPPCPCTVAAVSGREFEEEGIESLIFHPNSNRCFRERKR